MSILCSQRLYFSQAARLVAIATLVSTPLSLTPTLAATYDPYQSCAAELLEAGVERSVAVTACAGALHPEEVSACVMDIGQETGIAPADAIAACRRVRRPEEMSACVVDLNSNLESAVPLEVLDHCRRSLLPERYATCVLGISESTEYTALEAMTACISAGDRPRELAPSFIPRLLIEQPATDTPRLTPLAPVLTPIPGTQQ